ncbi:MAG: CPBP family intramembrane metalloprotease [Bacilli bacterium]|nr:CPBP family intramembrane metalloprotease [Bacilli bacterium]
MKEEKESLNTKNIIRGICVFILYFVLSFSAVSIIKLIGIDYDNMSLMAKQIYLICYNLGIVILFLFIYRKDIVKEFKDFKANYKEYFKGNIKYWLFALAVMYASNLIIAFIKYSMTGDISVAENEATIRETLGRAPIYTFISAAIFAPFIEELTFRKSLRKIFSNDVLFIIISSFIFGGLHVFTENVGLIDLLYLIPYCAPGVAFAYILVKTNNIFNTISLHLLHNTILMTLQVILLTKGLL